MFFIACVCDIQGTVGNNKTCDANGKCDCKPNIGGEKCNICSPGYYGFPDCKGR